MNITPRAAAQLRALPAGECAAVLDQLRDRTFPDGERTTVVEVDTPNGTYRAFAARHKNGDLVLLAIVQTQARGP